MSLQDKEPWIAERRELNKYSLEYTLLTAAWSKDLDTALRDIQDRLGIQSGDFASHYFTDLNMDPEGLYENSSFVERHTMLLKYVQAEIDQIRL